MCMTKPFKLMNGLEPSTDSLRMSCATTTPHKQVTKVYLV